MKSQYADMLSELRNPSQRRPFDKEWLVSIKAAAGMGGSSLTSGSYTQFKDFSGLNDYFEEIDLISGQDSGIKGICVSNVKIVLSRNQSSVQILKAFRENLVLESVTIIQIMKVGKNFQKVSSIVFRQCKITNAKIFLESIEFFFKYAERGESYSLVDANGASQGMV